MALSPRSGAAGANAVDSGATVTVTLSSGPSAGDLIFAAVNRASVSASTWGTMTPPHSLVSRGTQTLGSYGNIEVFTKIASGSEGTSFEFTNSIDQDSIAAAVFCISGVDGTTPTGTFNAFTNNDGWNIPSLTTANANSYAVVAICNDGDGNAGGGGSYLSGWTNSYVEAADYGNQYAIIGVAYRECASAGATGTAEVTGYGSDSLGFVVEVNEATGGGSIAPQAMAYYGMLRK